jgi:hypothetical protein
VPHNRYDDTCSRGVCFSRDPDRVAITWSGKSEGAIQEKAPLQEEDFSYLSNPNELSRNLVGLSTNELDGSDRFGLEAEGLDSRCQGCRFHTKQFRCTSRSGNLAVCLGQSRKDTITLTPL